MSSRSGGKKRGASEASGPSPTKKQTTEESAPATEPKGLPERTRIQWPPQTGGGRRLGVSALIDVDPPEFRLETVARRLGDLAKEREQSPDISTEQKWQILVKAVWRDVAKGEPGFMGQGSFGKVVLGTGHFRLASGERIQTKIVVKTIKDETDAAGNMHYKYFGPNPKDFRNLAALDAAYRVPESEYTVTTPIRNPLEFITIAALGHPHIVRLYDFMREPRPSTATQVRHYIGFLELIEGGDLYDYFNRVEVNTGRSFLADVILRTMTMHLFEALQFIHYHGIVHLDIKPENAMVSRHGDFKLVDFGLAAPVAKNADPSSPKNYGLHGAPGTPFFMATEMLAKREPVRQGVVKYEEQKRKKFDYTVGGLSYPRSFAYAVDPAAADVFSLGVTLAFLGLGRFPFPEDGDCYRSEDPNEKPWKIRIRPTDGLFGFFKNRVKFPAFLRSLLVDLKERRQRRGHAPISEAFAALIKSLINEYPERRPTARQVLRQSSFLAVDSDTLLAYLIAQYVQ